MRTLVPQAGISQYYVAWNYLSLSEISASKESSHMSIVVHSRHIAWTTAVGHRTAVPHTSYHLPACLSGHLVATAVFALITPHRTSNDGSRKPQIEDISNFIDNCHTNSIHVLNLHGFLCRFGLWHSNDILRINEKKVLLVLGPHFQRQEVSGNKANTS